MTFKNGANFNIPEIKDTLLNVIRGLGSRGLRVLILNKFTLNKM